MQGLKRSKVCVINTPLQPLIYPSSRWYCWERQANLPKSIQVALTQHCPQVRLHFIHYHGGDGSIRFNPESIPASNLVYLHVPHDQGDDSKLNALVASAHQLESLTVHAACRFSAAYGRLPALEYLRLDGTGDWPYTSEEVARIWDFSRLKSLSFIHRLNFTGSFINSVPARALLAVKSLDIDSEEDLESPDERLSSSTEISNFIRKLDRLEDLSTSTYYPIEIINGLKAHTQSLRFLSLQSRGPIVEEKRLGLQDITNIRVSCPNLEEFSLDLHLPEDATAERTDNMVRTSLASHDNYSYPNYIFQDFVFQGCKILASSRHLRKLNLTYFASDARGLYNLNIASDATGDYNRDFGIRVMEYLRARKAGVQLQELVLVLEDPQWHAGYFRLSADWTWDLCGKLTDHDQFVTPEDTSSSDSE